MRAPVVRIVAFLKLPETMNAADRRFAGSIEHVVLRDITKKTVVQPTKEEPFDVPVANALGANGIYQGLNVQFPLEALARIKNKDGEFFVTVVREGAKGEYDLKVSTKLGARLE